ncbi:MULTISPECIES: bifunctional UDP-N-acetylglucosamine diphosphorylase/glucosamine-1-phosphate N-acetyltransferase GlmU [Oerskovia]|uniref:Bifunctional protein GlmU n=1 Tax=Oerskovia gallyi TaxID=2762226 RepID=A0ABR8V478_9CELL|nr:bifunctional UDP-N-acetylglucosamine diphosphorylase/glucosamine-1-phosphate N-acetyltransferase GlmU [Oerskovia gallyi]MBD7999366.1 bifunctional UDP-N-acetylglucosamine diphosphorylase/glucosamine-1-phosphate N-acetyltransferase GlmU [Oerskovia gallyi]
MGAPVTDAVPDAPPVPAAVIVLAAGAGTRMRSATPKVLHTLAGRSMLGHAMVAARDLSPRRIAVVVRHERELVASAALEVVPTALVVDQDEVPGTGRAVQCAVEALDVRAQAEAAAHGVPIGHEGRGPVEGLDGSVVVLAGDIPLLDAATLTRLLDVHHSDGNAVTVLTTEVDDATGYGRIVRDDAGGVLAIVEHKDATDEQRAIREINSSVYVFDAGILRGALRQVTQENSQGEVYLTDVLQIAREGGGRVGALKVADPLLVEGANDRAQLATLRAELNRRLLTRWMLEGVTVIDPATTWVDVDVDLGHDVTLLPGTQLHGATSIGAGSTIGPDTTLTDMEVGVGATVTRTHGSLSVVGDGASVGPFAYLRPGTDLGAKGKIGTFVETKNATIGTGSKVPHLSYVGDATIGEHTNIGAASVTVNYDGVSKHRTVIGSHARTGADNMFVAPVTVGDGAYTAAGSVIRRDVPAGALGVSGAPQRNVDGWVARRRPGTAAADAAARAHENDGETPPPLGAQAQAQLAEATAATPAPRPTPAPASPGVPTVPDGPNTTTSSTNEGPSPR